MHIFYILLSFSPAVGLGEGGCEDPISYLQYVAMCVCAWPWSLGVGTVGLGEGGCQDHISYLQYVARCVRGPVPWGRCPPSSPVSGPGKPEENKMYSISGQN